MEHAMRILFNEEDPARFAADNEALRQRAITFEPEQARTKDEFLRALAEFRPDIIVTAYSSGALDGMTALRLVREKAPLVPVIVVIEPVDGETAARIIKAGATDYVFRDWLGCLGAAVLSALEKKRIAEEMRRAEASLEESRERFRSMVEVISDWIWEVDASGAYTYASPKVKDMLGYEPAEVLGKTPFDLMLPAEAERVKAVFIPLAQEHKPFSRLENTNRRKDGRQVVLETSGIPFFGAGGDFAGYRGIDRDITGRKRAEEALRESEHKFESLFLAVNEGVALHEMICDASGKAVDYRLLDVNPAYEAFTGIPRDRALGKRASELYGTGEAPYLDVYAEVAATGRPVSFETYFPPLRRHYRISVFSPERGRFATLFFDISDRKEAEAALLSSQQMLLNVIENFPGVVFWKDRSSAYLGANKTFIKAAGLERPEDIIGKTDFDLPWARAEAEAYRADDRVVMESGKPRLGIVETLTQADGRLIWFYTSKVPLFDANGKVIGVLGTSADITERRHAEIALKESYARLQRSLDGIINAMTAIVETRDPYTAGHQKRVAQLAMAIAKEMGLPEDAVNSIRIASIMHDIGKIYVPSEILSKPGNLSGVEMSIVQTHPLASYDILKKIQFPWPVAEIAREHQERYNGSGYPRGLAGKSILLEARILAVADVVEAMMFHRPYREAMGKEKALEEIQNNRGVLYDPEVADACIRLFREKNFTFVAPEESALVR
ncbi:MAG: HD domain-containing phosphohydrolase [Endomicrobiales bacterium]